MIHDFQMTTRFLIIPDLPMEADIKDAVKKNRFIFNFCKENTARYGILPRTAKDASEIKWFNVEGHYVFHFANSWDSVNELGQDIVTSVAVVHDTVNIDLIYEHFDVPEKPNLTGLEKFEFNMTTGEVRRKKLYRGKMEFPVVNQDMIGKKNKFVYCTHIDYPDDYKPTQKSKEDSFYNGFVKYDYEKEEVVKVVSYGETSWGGETFYH